MLNMNTNTERGTRRPMRLSFDDDIENDTNNDVNVIAHIEEHPTTSIENNSNIIVIQDNADGLTAEDGEADNDRPQKRKREDKSEFE